MKRPTICRNLLVLILACGWLAGGTLLPAVAQHTPTPDPAAPESSPTSRLRSVTTAGPGPRLTERDLVAVMEAIAGPVDAEFYQLGPGDRLQLAIPGVLETPLSLVVDIEGGVLLPGAAGRVEVTGSTLVVARERVAAALELEFRDRTFNLVLVGLRYLKVFVGGEVARPGTYIATSLTRVSEIIEQAGGVKAGGSERRIQIEDVDGGVRQADLVGFVLLGDRTCNPYVRGGDLIRVPPAGEFFSILGGVALPGSFELRPGETVADALALAGGPMPGAEPSQTEWRRLEEGGLDRGRRVDLADPAIGAETLRHGDVLVVPRDPQLANPLATVELVGEVRYPGVYPIRPGIDTAREVIERAGGWTEWSNRAGTRLLRAAESPYAGVARTRLLDLSREARAPVGRAMEHVIRRDWPHAVATDWQTLRAAADVRLEDGDVIRIPRLTGRVIVEGRVRRPGMVPWRVDQRVDEYIELAGGFDKGANPGHLFLRRAGSPPGELAEVGGGATLQDGDLIWVAERRQVSLWTRVREASAFLAQLATVAIIIDQVTRD